MIFYLKKKIKLVYFYLIPNYRFFENNQDLILIIDNY